MQRKVRVLLQRYTRSHQSSLRRRNSTESFCLSFSSSSLRHRRLLVLTRQPIHGTQTTPHDACNACIISLCLKTPACLHTHPRVSVSLSCLPLPLSTTHRRILGTRVSVAMYVYVCHPAWRREEGRGGRAVRTTYMCRDCNRRIRRTGALCAFRR